MRVAALVAVATIGCAHAPAARTIDPDATLRAWAQAIATNDTQAAHRLLSSSLRESIREADFAMQWKAALPDLAAQQDALRAGHAVRSASGELADGSAWPLAHEERQWRLGAAQPLDPGGDTPVDAVRRLVAAIEARDFDAVLTLLAEPLRSTVEQALAERLGRLKTALARGHVEASGGTARLRYDPRYHIDLVQENGRWRIADFN